MKKFIGFIIIFTGIICHFVTAQTVRLTAVYSRNNFAVKLNWNMVNSNSKTSYLLLRSADGVTWTEAAKDRMPRIYSNNDVYIFNDRNYLIGRNFYRLKIADSYNNTVALSPIVFVSTAGIVTTAATPTYTKPQNTVQQKTTIPQPMQSRPQNNSISPVSNINSWIIYPNPATDILRLAYRGSGDLKGVVNVEIQDETGKVKIKFRSGSMYKNIEIPISNLRRGIYFIQVSVQNEMMMSQRFIKQ